MKQLLLASSNKHKVEEFNQILNPMGYQVVGLADLGIRDEIPETGLTLEENAALKALYLKQHLGMPCLAEDTGLEVNALAGAPGVFSARFAGEPKSDEKNIQKLLEQLDSHWDRSARFRTIICMVDGPTVHYFEGICPGNITLKPQGEGGFGYDPVFKPEQADRTFGEMSMEEKSAYSHRARAIVKLVEYLAEGSDFI